MFQLLKAWKQNEATGSQAVQELYGKHGFDLHSLETSGFARPPSQQRAGKGAKGVITAVPSNQTIHQQPKRPDIRSRNHGIHGAPL